MTETADWLFAIIRSFKCDLSMLGTHDDIRAELLLHLHNRVLPAYRPGRGKLFSLVTFSCRTYILTLLDKAARLARHYIPAATFALDSAEDWIDQSCNVEPEVYSLPAEIREKLDHFTAPGEDFEFFLVRNLVVYSYQRGGRTVPTLEQISQIVSEIVSLEPSVAYQQTEAAVILLKKELSDFRGRPSLYRSEPALKSDQSPQATEKATKKATAQGVSSQALKSRLSRPLEPVRKPAFCLYD